MDIGRSMQRISGAVSGILGRLAFFRIGMRTVLSASALGLILVVAVIFRAMPIRYGVYFTAYDPLFQYRMTEYIVRNGFAAWFSWHDTLSWYPMGRNVAQSSFPGLPFSAAFIYNLLQVLGVKVSVHDICLFFPLLMASLTCLSAYFLGRDLGGNASGLLTAFFMAVSSAFMSRTSLGFFDTETIGIFCMVTISLLFLRSIEKDKPVEKRVLYAIAAGLSLAYLYASWGASRYITGLLALFMFASILIKLFDRRYLVSYGFTMGVGYFFALFVPKLGPTFLLSMENFAVLGFFFFLVAYDFMRERIQTKILMLMMGGLLILLVAGVFALQSLGLITSLSGKFLSVLDPSIRSEAPLLESVAEHKRAVWTHFFNDFGLTIGLALFGSYFALRRKEEKQLYSLIFFLSSIYFTGSMVRLALILSIPASLMAAYGLKELLTPFVSAVSRSADRRPRRRRAVFGIGREMGIIFTVFILITILPTVWSAAGSADRPTSLASSSIGGIVGGRYPQDWLQALVWMRDNTPENSVVVSWWDYGYWIETMANRTTLADGATLNTRQIAQIGRVMMYNQSDSMPILRKYSATHIVVFNTFNPNNPSQQWPFGDNVKWSWMAQIAGLNVSDYITEQDYSEKYLETTLYNLMNMRADSSLFKLVFASENRFVLVYRIVY